jgi:cytochrome c biogenesis protein
MNGNQDTIPGTDVPGPSSSGLGWDEFSREWVEFFASIKPAMFLCKRMGVPETFITDQQGVIRETVIGPRD